MFSGGYPDADSWGTYNDTWALALSGAPQWNQLDAGGWLPGHYPQSRALHSLIQDPIGDRMILVGGFVPGAFPRGPFDDAWEFRFDDLTWHLISSEDAALPVWTTPASVYDSRRRRALVFENDWLWSLQLASEGQSRRKLALEGGPAVMGEDVRETFSLRLDGPNPFSETLEAEVSLRGIAPGRLALFDVAGRRVWCREIDPEASLRQLVRAEGIGWLRPGVYLLQLTQGHATRTVRIVHAR